MSDLSSLESLRFPIGRWQRPEEPDLAAQEADQVVIAAFPALLVAKVAHATDAQLDTPYRPEGWTVRQVVHHCADSHINCLIRLKLALTEDQPTIKPYAEERWAELPDYQLPIETSLRLLESVHARITYLLARLSPGDWGRMYIHPQYGTTFTIAQVVSLYAWHCRHHFGHVCLVMGN